MKIYQKRETIYLWWLLIILIGLEIFILSLLRLNDTVFAAFLMLFTGVVLVAVSAYKNWKLNKAIKNLAHTRLTYARNNNIRFSPLGDSLKLNTLALNYINGSRDESFFNCLSAPDWQYCDFLYNYYRKTKYGEYRAGTVYYGVMTAKLPRKLPNVFFDSKKSRGRQFRLTFTRDQKHSLEGNFDTFFATYFPVQYTIDSMSFISPDVMQALIDASEYDIEIKDDLLCLYGPISTDERDIEAMANKLNVVKKQLLDNILTYRDERLPFGVGRQQVAIQGMSLKKSQFFKWLTIAGLVLYFIVRIAIEILSNMN